MKTIVLFIALLTLSAHSAELLISPSVTLDSQDVMAGLKTQLGEAERQQILANPEQLRRVVDGFYLSQARRRRCAKKWFGYSTGCKGKDR